MQCGGLDSYYSWFANNYSTPICHADKSGCLTDLQLATACLLGFSGFLRFNELRSCDVVIEADLMRIRITRSKTDQLRLGNSVVVARSETLTCPVAMLECYLSGAATVAGDERFLLCPIQSTKKMASF